MSIEAQTFQGRRELWRRRLDMGAGNVTVTHDCDEAGCRFEDSPGPVRLGRDGEPVTGPLDDFMERLIDARDAAVEALCPHGLDLDDCSRCAIEDDARWERSQDR